MSKYFVRRVEKNKKTGILFTVLYGKQDMGFDLGQFFGFPHRIYLINEYGFNTIPSAKRCWAYRNQKDTVGSTVIDVKIVKLDVDEDGRITMEDVNDEVR